MRISYEYTYNPFLLSLPPTQPHPTQVITEHPAEFPYYTVPAYSVSSSHMVVYISQHYSLSAFHPVLPRLVPKSVLYICDSVPPLQRGVCTSLV